MVIDKTTHYSHVKRPTSQCYIFICCMLRVNQAFDNSAKEAVDLFSKIKKKTNNNSKSSRSSSCRSSNNNNFIKKLT